jgi:ATP-dependent RNA helicase DeaD
MADGVWFRLNVGRERKADPKWLLPEICRQGELTKKDIGAIKVFDTETLFQVDAKIAEKFAAMVGERKKGGVRIMPAQDQSGESRARQSAPQAPAENAAAVPDAESRKEGGFHQRKFGQKFEKKKFEKKKFGKKPFNRKKPGSHPPKRTRPAGP